MTVQDNIPIPTARSHGSKYAHFLDDLTKPMQSKFIPCPKGADKENFQKRISGQAYARFGAGNYATRLLTEGRKIGVRVWRTA